MGHLTWIEVQYFIFFRCLECNKITCLLADKHECDANSIIDHVIEVDPLGCL